ncbi:MAG: M3 family oligoendopeptidase [Candidatus Pacearchaeota archaeon]
METEWNLKLLFNSDDDPAIEEYQNWIKKKVSTFIKKWGEDNSYLTNSSALKQALNDYSSLEIVGPAGGDGSSTKDGFYFWLRTQQDQNDSELKAKYNKSIEFGNDLMNSIRFFIINIGKIESGKQIEFLDDESLNEYKHFLERIFAEAKYTLSLGEENILALKQTPAHEQWDKMLSGFLSKEERFIDENGKEVKKNFAEIINLLNSQIKKTRDSAAIAFNDILKKFSEVAEAEINAILTNKKIDDKLRKVERPDFIRHLSDDIDSEIVDSLIDVVSSRFDISERYYKLKAKLLGLKKLEYHERNVVYGSVIKKYSYEEAFDLVKETFSNLDKEFLEIFLRLNKNKQVDIFPKKGKRQGAFCTDSLLYQPTYILLNHTNELNDVLTIAHESGHAINSELMKKNCNTLSCGMVLSTAEVASTFMEDFILKKLLENADDESKLALMMSQLNDEVSTIMRQVACYKFEQELHKEFREKGYLSKEEIGKIFMKNMSAYMGEAVEQSDGAENWWIYWHHIRTFFYVYSYASGLLISKSLQSMVRKNKKEIQKVKEFLSSGASDSPKNIFMKMNIDITKKDFWDKGLNEVEELLNETEKLAKKLGKI